MLVHKQRRVYLLLMITLLLSNTITASAAPEAGFFDDMEGSAIVGWGWDPSTPNTAVPVHVMISNQQTGEVVGIFDPTAAIYREDLADNQIGNGRHGFRINMDWDSLPDGTYLIEGWVESKLFANIKTYVNNAVAGEEAQKEAGGSAAGHAAANGLQSLGSYRITGYCPCYQCSEGWGRNTSTGATAQSNHTIAVDPSILPYGSKVMIGGIVYTAEDRGGGVKGKHIDIFVDHHDQTYRVGSQSQEVFLIQ